MKKIFIIILIVLSINSNAQSLSDSVGNPGFTLIDTIANKLAELAINNITFKVDDAEIKGLNYEIKKNKATWLNSFNASFNLNEANINAVSSTSGQENVYFPRYNFSFTLPIGSLITKAKDVQIAKARHEKALAVKDLSIENLKNSIKMQYQNYQANKYLLALHETILQDEKVLLSNVESKFENNEAGYGLEVLTATSKRYNDELAKKINLLKDLNNSKVLLESLLGMSLEDAMLKIAEQ